jgi:hypothetical protein
MTMLKETGVPIAAALLESGEVYMTPGAHGPLQLTCSIVIEWDNARWAELRRPRRMAQALAAEIGALDATRVAVREIFVVYDRREVPRELIEEATRALAAPPPQLLATDGLRYYQLKNLGARSGTGEVVIFIDSDVVPEGDWLSRLLEPFRDPGTGVVCGSTYVELETYFSRTVGLWWFFATRDPRKGLLKTTRFWANNVAFRRSVFLPAGFPELPSFRGQCLVLANRFRRLGIPILQRVDARVAHPPPKGGWHFICQGLTEGHDRVVLLAMHRLSTKESWLASWRRFSFSLRDARRRVREKRGQVGVSALGGAGALALAFLYYSLSFAGERIGARWPWVIRRYFPI